MARSRSTKAQNARPVDFKSAIYIGEDVMPAFPKDLVLKLFYPMEIKNHMHIHMIQLVPLHG